MTAADRGAADRGQLQWTASVCTLLKSVNARFLIPSRPPRSSAIDGVQMPLIDDFQRRSMLELMRTRAKASVRMLH